MKKSKEFWESLRNLFFLGIAVLGFCVLFYNRSDSGIIVGLLLMAGGISGIAYNEKARKEMERQREEKRRRLTEERGKTPEGQREHEISIKTNGLPKASKEEVDEWLALDEKRQNFINQNI